MLYQPRRPRRLSLAAAMLAIVLTAIVGMSAGASAQAAATSKRVVSAEQWQCATPGADDGRVAAFYDHHGRAADVTIVVLLPERDISSASVVLRNGESHPSVLFLVIPAGTWRVNAYDGWVSETNRGTLLASTAVTVAECQTAGS